MLPLEHGYEMTDDPSFPLGMDAVKLAHFAAAQLPEKARVCEPGCGAGGVLLLLLANRPDITAVGVERRTDAAELARENLRHNRTESRAVILTADLRELPALGRFDAVVMNPPYRPENAGRLPRDPDAAAARTELYGTLSDFLRISAALLGHFGEAYFCYPPERLTDLLTLSRRYGLEPKTLTFVQASPDDAPCLVLCRMLKGGHPGLTVTAPVPV
ncbi:MAG: tRNA1(Val) (adenine(37)-N6)-methyltransferase [Eubacteriales bacterium]|jgi:tRNA1Val (adenine37-N6)-methyltransferase